MYDPMNAQCMHMLWPNVSCTMYHVQCIMYTVSCMHNVSCMAQCMHMYQVSSPTPSNQAAQQPSRQLMPYNRYATSDTCTYTIKQPAPLTMLMLMQ